MVHSMSRSSHQRGEKRNGPERSRRAKISPPKLCVRSSRSILDIRLSSVIIRQFYQLSGVRVCPFSREPLASACSALARGSRLNGAVDNERDLSKSSKHHGGNHAHWQVPG